MNTMMRRGCFLMRSSGRLTSACSSIRPYPHYHNHRSIIMKTALRTSSAAAPPSNDKDKEKPKGKSPLPSTSELVLAYMQDVASSREKQKRLLANIAIGTGVTIGVYGISSTVAHLTSYLLNINFKTVGYMGFGAGFLSATISAGGLLYLRRYFTIVPEDVFRLSMYQLQNNGDVLRAMGDTLVAGKLKAYNISNGHFGTSSVSKEFGWRAPKCQMLFHVVGPYSEGIATVEAQQVNGKTTIKMLALDVMDNPEGKHELLLVAGDANRLHVVGQLRGFLQTERVKYLRQYLNHPLPSEKK